MTRTYLLAPLALALLLAACGGGGDDTPATASPAAPAATPAAGNASVTTSGDTTTVRTDDGEMTVGGGSVPEGFPEQLVYPGGAVVSSITVDEDRIILVLSTPDSIDDILDFYEDAFDAVGLGDDGERLSAASFGSYSVGDQDTGSGVLVEGDAADNGDNLVTIGYAAP